jgi:hypothetical protein
LAGYQRADASRSFVVGKTSDKWLAVADDLPICHQYGQDAKNPGWHAGLWSGQEEPAAVDAVLQTVGVWAFVDQLETMWAVATHGDALS